MLRGSERDTNIEYLEGMDGRLKHIEQAFFGDERIGLTGIHADIKATRDDIKKLMVERDRIRSILIGIAIAVAVTGGASALSFATIVRLAGVVFNVPVP